MQEQGGDEEKEEQREKEGERERESEGVMCHDKKASWDLCAWKCAQQYVMPLLSPYLLIDFNYLFLISQPVLSLRGQLRLTGKGGFPGAHIGIGELKEAPVRGAAASTVVHPIEHVRNDMLKGVRDKLEQQKTRDRGGDIRKKKKSTPDALDDRLLECNPINGVLFLRLCV